MDLVVEIRQRLQTKIIDMGQRPGRPHPKPGDPSDFANDERKLGFTFPPLLKRLYAEVGNGGFGPGYGLIGLTNGVPNDLGETAPAIYEAFRHKDPEDRAWQWPEALLPICHWGCAIVSCIDCIDTNFRMRIFDPNVFDKDWSDCFFEESPGFEHWIKAWAAGADLWDTMYGTEGHIVRILRTRHPDRF